MSLAEKIRRARLEAGLTQQQFCERTGVAFSTASRWERGKATPYPRQITLVAQATGKPASFFQEEDDESERVARAGDALMAALRFYVAEAVSAARAGHATKEAPALPVTQPGA